MIIKLLVPHLQTVLVQEQGICYVIWAFPCPSVAAMVVTKNINVEEECVSALIPTPEIKLI